LAGVFGNHDIISRRTREKGCASKQRVFFAQNWAKKRAHVARGAPTLGLGRVIRKRGTAKYAAKVCLHGIECGRAAGLSRAMRPSGPTTKGSESAFQLPLSSGCQVLPSSRLIFGAVGADGDPGFEGFVPLHGGAEAVWRGGGGGPALQSPPCARRICLIHLAWCNRHQQHMPCFSHGTLWRRRRKTHCTA